MSQTDEGIYEDEYVSAGTEGLSLIEPESLPEEDKVDDPDDDDDFLLSQYEDEDSAGQDWNPDHGFWDPQRAVGVWVDDDGIPNRVKLSNNWRKKLEKSSLAVAVTYCFTVIRDYYGARHDPVLPELELGEVPAYSLERVQELRAQRGDVLKSFDQLPVGERALFVTTYGPAVYAKAVSGYIEVELDAYGRPNVAWFGKNYLADAPRRQIERGITFAIRRARESYVEYGEPPIYLVTEAGVLMQKYDLLDRKIQAMEARLIEDGE